MKRRASTALATCALVASIIGACWTGIAVAAFVSSTSASHTLSTLTLATPASASSSTSNACATVTVSWSAVAAADAYRVQVREGAGAWTDLVTETANVTTIPDSGGHTNTDVYYRVYARDANSNWESPSAPVSAKLTCGIGLVTDLAVTNPCSKTVLTWSAPTGANNYDVLRRVNGGSWTTLATNQASTGYTDNTVHATGALVEYYVVPGATLANGTASTIASIASWDSFRVSSVTVANSGTAGTLNAGDSITVTFTKPITTSTIATHSIRVDNSGTNRGLYIATTTASTAGVGRLMTVATQFGATVTYAGTGAFGGGNTTYTWTSTVAGTTMTGALAGTWTAGTGPLCAADSSALQSSTPTTSGTW